MLLSLTLLSLMLVGCGVSESVPVAMPAKHAEDNVADVDAEVVAAEDHATEDAVRELRRSIAAKDWRRAATFTQQAMIAQPGDVELMVEVAQVLAMNDERREAALLMVEATTLGEFVPESRVDFTVQALMDVGELYAAIDLLERVLQSQPENFKLRRQLIGFLGEAQRTRQIQPHLFELIRRRQFDLQLLLTATETSSRRLFLASTETLLQRNPDDRRVLIGRAYERMSEQDLAGAESVVREILERHPGFAPALAVLGQVLAEQRRFEEFDTWLQTLPEECQSYPEYWLAVGDWENERKRVAASCQAYWRATQCDANLGAAWSRLAQSLGALTESDAPLRSVVTAEQTEDIGRRINHLVELHCSFYDFHDNGDASQTRAAKVAECLLNLGRHWEAEAWSAIATTLTQEPSTELTSLRETILSRLRDDRAWQSRQGQLALAIDLSGGSSAMVSGEPRLWKRAKVVSKRASSEHLKLAEMSDAWGLTSVGGNNSPDEHGLAPLIYANGVGGGAIDYDLDGWPDLVVMGAGGTMLQQNSKPNVLMRNVSDRFVSVTSESGVGDTRFGQGVAVGDFDEDGFLDLFFANLGANRLLRNNGDGTFTDCSNLLGDREAQWTTSASFLDLNDDGLTDLLATNYCKAGPELSESCLNAKREPGPCHPLKFTANRDQLAIADPRGHLVDCSRESLPEASVGRGLGIIAGALDGRRLCALVANDMSANHFYRFRPGQKRLTDTAAIHGLAVDGRAMPQASMGIAASDFDLDGDLDLYVTGFAREYNIYYEQVSPGYWRDKTRRLNLIQPTLNTVGFGTQALDVDNDGVDEIVVTNGHIGDFNDPHVPPYAQPFQLFRRGPKGTFRLVDDDHWGDYLRENHVGRALWLIDVNRDGRRDVMITHTHEPVSLLVNQTESLDHWIRFRLVGTRSSRDATGAILRLECDGKPRTVWALAGDGYMCSSERVLHAGLGDATSVNNVTVTWLGGRVDEFGSLDADGDYLLVEASDSAFALTPDLD